MIGLPPEPDPTITGDPPVLLDVVEPPVPVVDEPPEPEVLAPPEPWFTFAPPEPRLMTAPPLPELLLVPLPPEPVPVPPPLEEPALFPTDSPLPQDCETRVAARRSGRRKRGVIRVAIKAAVFFMGEIL
jgi:hypothetical protein